MSSSSSNCGLAPSQTEGFVLIFHFYFAALSTPFKKVKSCITGSASLSADGVCSAQLHPSGKSTAIFSPIFCFARTFKAYRCQVDGFSSLL